VRFHRQNSEQPQINLFSVFLYSQNMPPKTTQWRLIPPIHASGQWQMAIDRWLLERHAQAHHPSTLRFYTWSPVALSLGHFQRNYPTHWHQIHWRGIPLDIVRRPSGGRAVLHQGDLTYALITSGLRGDRKQNYQHLCQFLINGWRNLGIHLHYGQAGRSYLRNPNCFGTATPADLVDTQGRKLIGSAQKYQGSAVLHHGSMRLMPDASLLRQVFGDREDSIVPMPPELPVDRLFESVIKAITLAAQDYFDIELIIAPLSPEEQVAIAGLITDCDRHGREIRSGE
jgi:lipoate-protein ligase A